LRAGWRGDCSLFSWHAVEKPIQERKKIVLRWVQGLVGRIRPQARQAPVASRETV
jgi:hypothetical protein